MLLFSFKHVLIFSILFGVTKTLTAEQPSIAPSPIESILPGIVSSVKSEQLKNAHAPIEVTP